MFSNINSLSEKLDLSENMLFTKPTDIKYLVGTGTDGGVEVLVRNKKIYILSNPLYLKELESKFGNFDVINTDDAKLMKKVFGKIQSLIVDGTSITLNQQKKFEEFGVKNLDISKRGMLTDLRKIKSKDELEVLKESQKINVEVLKTVIKNITLGITEFDIAQMIKVEHLKLGASGESFEPIVAFGKSASEPHHINSKIKKLKKGDSILFDLGCIYEGYCSDMTRVVFTTKNKAKELELYLLLKNIHDECIKFGKIGTRYKDFHYKAVELLGKYAKNFIHNLGHGIGLDIHEFPIGMKNLDDKIEENEVFSVEPGVYFHGKYGFRYENVVVATKKGLVDILGDIENDIDLFVEL
ncbi:M24 family metallopeptidase [Candidatus Gracilibacteria bacterium]|nr:M24 family metallopeptidase [Candidatus Gracilibacteria bacterium]